MKQLFIHSFSTKWGQFRTASTEHRLVMISMPSESQGTFDDRIADQFKYFQVEKEGLVNEQAEKEIRLYLNSKLKKFSVKFDIMAAPFQKKVLRYVSRIPFGKVKSYGEVAAGVGNPRASRAVGTANARNNLPLIIPCHRVVASNGLGGYGGGLWLKKKLLLHEGVSY